MNLRRDGTTQWVARAGLPVWILLVAAAALNGYAVITEVTKSDGFFVDQFFLPLICGLVAATVLAVATSGVLLRGRTLVAIDVVTVNVLDADQVVEVEDASGLTIIARGRRIQPYVCGRTLTKQLNQNARLRLAGEAIRAWQSDHFADADLAAATVPRWTPRWVVILGVPGWAALSGLATVALHAVV